MRSSIKFATKRARGGKMPWPSSLCPATGDRRFFCTHLWLPLAAFVAIVVAVAAARLDWRVAQTIFSWEGHRWLFRHAFMTETVVHRFGRDASIAAWLGVLLAFAFAYRRPSLAAWRAPLAYLLLSVMLSTLLVSWIKSWSNMDCPWDIAGLGGTHPYLGLFDPRPRALGHNACFPAGHASGGYAWMAMYFFFKMTRPRWRYHGLAVGIAFGALFGIGQQLRGAHFLSHDLWTAAICWLVALSVYGVFRDRMLRSVEERRWDTFASDQ